MADLTDLQREILVTARNNPRATQQEIAEMADCSRSYVGEVLNRYDNVSAFEAELGQLGSFDRDLSLGWNQQPVWMDSEGTVGQDMAAVNEGVDQSMGQVDEELDEGLQALGEMLRDGWKGLKTLIRKFR